MNNKKREVFFFILSGIAHAVFLYWVLHAHMDVKVFMSRQEITEVVIVTSGKLHAPLLSKTDSTENENQRNTNRHSSPEVTRSVTQPPVQTPAGHSPSPFQYQTPSPDLSLQSQAPHPFSVDLDLSLKSDVDADTDYKKILSRLEAEEGTPIHNLTRHLTAGAPGETNGSTYVKVKNFDIKPWSQRVINRVNNQWIIPLALKVGVSGIVGVTTTITKNGDIAEAAIKQSSGLDTLDRAALAAVENSAPFPALPGDFPYETIEAYFVFEYGI